MYFECYHTCCSSSESSAGRNPEKNPHYSFQCAFIWILHLCHSKRKTCLIFHRCLYIHVCKLSGKKALFKFKLANSSTVWQQLILLWKWKGFIWKIWRQIFNNSGGKKLPDKSIQYLWCYFTFLIKELCLLWLLISQTHIFKYPKRERAMLWWLPWSMNIKLKVWWFVVRSNNFKYYRWKLKFLQEDSMPESSYL